MTCANHPERVATAFCQNCGKALCPLCTRTHAGLLLCEPCLLEREAAPAAANPAGWTQVPGSIGAMPGAGQAVPPAMGGAPYGVSASPVLAGLLGFIPGVGAMYNGQFIKALLHVVIFIVLVGASSHFGLAGILIAAWVFYQVFDAAQTAAARRDGRPLPDPFGILDMSQRLGPHAGVPPVAAPGAVPPQWAQAPYASPQYAPSPSMPPGAPPPAAENWQTGMPQYAASAGTAWAAQPYQAAPAVATPPMPPRRSEPVGAIVLIVVGLLFLLSTLGWLNVNWIARGWPVLVLLLGVWLLVRRVQAPPAGSQAVPAVPPAPVPGAPANALSIAPWRGDAPREASGDDARREEDRS